MNVSASDTGRLDIMEASLSDAGLYECRIIFTDGEVEGPVSIGFLTVIGIHTLCVREGGVEGNGSSLVLWSWDGMVYVCMYMHVADVP